MILIIDNYDSFVHNLARYVREAGRQTRVIRNDQMSAEEMIALAPDGVIISPGPKTPGEAGVSMEFLKQLNLATPMLGVCLGHHCLVERFGGKTVRAVRPLHGEASEIRHDGKGIFAGIASPLTAGRYHSLISVMADNSPLRAAAWSAEDELMAVRHEPALWTGVQFHPESLLTLQGRQMIANFLDSI